MPVTRERPVFDSYATLVVKKLLLPSEKTKYVAVERGFLADVLRNRLEQIRVDEEWYLDGNPDVRDAVRSGVVKNARAHYVSHRVFRASHALPDHRRRGPGIYRPTKISTTLCATPFSRPGRRILTYGVIAKGACHLPASGWKPGVVPFSRCGDRSI